MLDWGFVLCMFIFLYAYRFLYVYLRMWIYAQMGNMREREATLECVRYAASREVVGAWHISSGMWLDMQPAER